MGGKNVVRRARRLRAAPGRARGRRRRLPVGGPALHRHRARARAPQDRGSLHRRARAGACASCSSATPRTRACSPARSRRTARSPSSRRAIEAARKAGAEPIVAGREAAGRLLPHGVAAPACPTASHHVAGLHRPRGVRPRSLRRGHRLRRRGDRGDRRDRRTASSNAVFTASRARFEQFYARTRSGILNRNRSTNLASPKLPFGGVGQQRQLPAGGRVGAPQRRVRRSRCSRTCSARSRRTRSSRRTCRASTSIGSSAQHAAEEARRGGAHARRSAAADGAACARPAALPESEALLARLYAGDRVPKEKKPPVFDHLRSAGPWMVSIDAEPLAVLDGMSQTATVVGGFAEDPVVRAYTEGEFADTLVANDDTAVARDLGRGRVRERRCASSCPGCRTSRSSRSGAEANEKAMALCRINCARKDATKVLAFEGSFHGRTLLALHATHSPSKRAPFELAGYQCSSRRSRCGTRRGDEPAAPSGFYAAAATGEIDELEERFGDAKDDALLAAEVASLAAVHAALATGEYFCCDHRADAERGRRSLRDRAVLPRAAPAHALPPDVPRVRRGPGRVRPRRAVRVALEVPPAQRARPAGLPRRRDVREARAGRRRDVAVRGSRAGERAQRVARARAHPRRHGVDEPQRRAPREARACRGSRSSRARIRTSCSTRARPATRSRSICRRRRCSTRSSASGSGAARSCSRAGTRTARYRLQRFVPRARDRSCCSRRSAARCRGSTRTRARSRPSGRISRRRRRRRAPQAELRVPPGAARRGDGSPAGDPRHRVPGLRAGAAHAAGGDPRGDRGSRGLADRRARRRRRAARRSSSRSRSAAPLEQSKDVEGCDDDPMLGKHNTMYSVSITVAPSFQSARHRPQAQGAAAARRGARARAPTARRAIAT